MNNSFIVKSITALSLILAASSCTKEKQVEVPTGTWTSYFTEYSFDGTVLDPYSSNGPCTIEQFVFEDSGACTVKINGVENHTSFTTNGNTLTIQGYGDFRLVQNTGFTLIIGVSVKGDDSAKSVFEYKRGSEDSPLATIYSNYTSYDGTDNRIFWYLEKKDKRVYCLPIVGSKYFDKLYSDGKTLLFYDEMLYHFKKQR